MISGYRRIGIVIAAVVAAAVCGPASAAVLVIDSAQNPSGYAESPAFGGSFGGSSVNGTYRATATSGATATYTPGNVGSFTPGTYDVYVTWSVHATHSAAVNNNFANTVAVSGSLTNVINQTQNSNGAITQLEAPQTGGSGYRLLGSYTLGSTSTLTLSRAGTTTYTADAMMIRDRAADGLFIDQQSSNVSASVGSGFSFQALATAPSGNYHATGTTGATLIWDPGAATPGHLQHPGLLDGSQGALARYRLLRRYRRRQRVRRDRRRHDRDDQPGTAGRPDDRGGHDRDVVGLLRPG